MKGRVATVGLALVVLAGAAASGAGAARPNTFPAEKQAMADKIAALKAADPAPAPKIAPPAAAEGIPAPAVVAGGVPAGLGRMFTEAETMRPPGYPDDTFTNSWSVTSDSLNIDVWAAARGSDPRRGFLLVVIWNQDRTQVVGGGEFEPSVARGALRIVAAEGTTISAQSNDGTVFSLDATRPRIN